MPDSINAKLLDEVNESRAWFHAKKTRSLWAQRIADDGAVETLEGPMNVQAGEYLCRGEAGDVWPQRAETLTQKYTATDTVDADGWREFVPRPDDEGVLAAEVEHAFAIESKWGRLHGKPHDYVVKRYGDKDLAHPDDVWIVDHRLFHATYQRVTTTALE